ncbi:MAG: HAD family hydrolase [Phycisphaerae bacterium]|nr:HAD family hydrolase [Phycisphaerae bacterium]
MSDHIEQLTAFAKTKDFFIGIDSDGCAFDTMEPKHKACFYPMTVEHWDLAGVAKYARDVWDFVNLYGQTRGCNRFLALLGTFDHLDVWDEVAERGFRSPPVEPLRQWVEQETKLGNPALEAKVAETNDPVLTRALGWSRAINEQVARTVHDVPPFPHVRECLERVAGRADVMVVSATPNEALEREWAEHDIARYTSMICGQEMGKKSEHLRYGAGGKYDADKVLMIGDAPGDMKAAKANDALFYPIMPGDEDASWQRFGAEAAERFFAGDYAGDYEQQLIDAFMAHLPAEPPWKR